MRLFLRHSPINRTGKKTVCQARRPPALLLKRHCLGPPPERAAQLCSPGICFPISRLPEQHKGPSLYLRPQSSFYWFPAPFPFSCSKACKWLRAEWRCRRPAHRAACVRSPQRADGRIRTQEKGSEAKATRLDADPAPFTFTFDERKEKLYSQFSEWKSGTNCSSLSGT